MISYLGNSKTQYVQIYFMIIAIVTASVLGLVIIGMSYLDTHLWVVIAAVAGVSVFMIGLGRPLIGIYLMVFASAFIDYRTTNEVRLFVKDIPINLIEVTLLLAVLLALPSFLLNLGKKDWKYGALKCGPFALWIVFLEAIYILSFIRGAASYGLYDASRDIRPIILIGISFLLTHKCVTSLKAWKTIVTIIFLGGIYGMIFNIIIPILTGIQHMPYYSSYLDIRSLRSSSASIEFVFILGIAFIVCKHYIFGRKSLAWILVLISFLTYFISFSMTEYAFTIIVPLLCLLLAPVQLPRKLKIGIALAGLPIIVLYYGVTTFTEIKGLEMFENITYLLGQASEKLRHLSSSIHAQSRLFSWSMVLSELSGSQFLVGLGMGKRLMFSIPELAIVLIGEPTYSTYLLGVGLIGLIMLLVLQLKFVLVSYYNMRYSTDTFIRAIMLAFAVYGLTTIINGFLHNNFMSPQNSVLFGVLLGLTEVMRRIGTDERGRQCTSVK